MQITKNIRTLRLSRGYSAQFMADKLGVPRTTYINWESQTEPELTIIKSLADIFGVHYVQVIDGIEADIKNLPNSAQPDLQPVLSNELIYGAIREVAEAVKKIERRMQEVYPEGKDNLLAVKKAIRNKDSVGGTGRVGKQK